MKVNINEAYELISDTLMAGLVPNLLGSPGLGKSDIIKKVGKDFNLKIIDFRLAQADPTDMSGFPTIDKDTKKSYYAPPETFPLKTDKVPDGYDGWLLFFDEMNSAPMSVQAAAYKIILDRMVGQEHLHKKVAMVCAGNLTTDKAIVNRLSTTMQSRMIHFNLEVDNKAWIAWGHENAIDHRIMAFIQFKPELLHDFNPKHSDNTFPCPRTWHFLSKLIAPLKDIDYKKLPLISGTIGEGAARTFTEFTKIYHDLPTLTQILSNPETLQITKEPSTQYAISSMLGANAKSSNISDMMKFVNRLPIEFQVITLQGIIKRSKELLKSASIQAWVSVNAKELI